MTNRPYKFISKFVPPDLMGHTVLKQSEPLTNKMCSKYQHGAPVNIGMTH